MIQAIISNRIYQVKKLIAEGDDVNQKDAERRSPLHLAAFVGSSEITSLLLKNGARVNARDKELVTPLHRACRLVKYDK